MENFPPNGSTIVYYSTDENCDGDNYTCKWVDLQEDGQILEYEVTLSADNLETNCGLVFVEYSHMPCRNLQASFPLSDLVSTGLGSVTQTEVSFMVSDTCGNSINWRFFVEYHCFACDYNSSSACGNCGGGQTSGEECLICDPSEFASGYKTCSPPCEDPSCPRLTPDLCSGGAVERIVTNPSWFTFKASSDSLNFILDVSECSISPNGTIGLQASILEECALTIAPCLGGIETCTVSETSFSVGNLNVGTTYYLWIDGCGGSQCNFEITIQDIVEVSLDTPHAIRVSRACDDLCLSCTSEACVEEPSVTVCPGECIDLVPLHLGDVGLFPGYNSPCDSYSKESPAIYTWTTWEGEQSSDPTVSNGFFIPSICVPSELGSYEICLTGIDNGCNSLAGVNTCVTIEVQAPETITRYFELREDDLDVLVDGPWTPEGNWGDFPWLGPALDQFNTEGWNQDLNDPEYFCQTFENTFGCSDCVIAQTICIDLIDVVAGDQDGDGVPQEDDCDDMDPNNFPGNTEACDGQDNNCDGNIDEGLVFITFYLDADGDGFGSQSDTISNCSLPQGYVPNSDDCDDSNPNIYPGSEELCDDIDNNCDGEIDEGLTFLNYYLDADLDGYGSEESVIEACAAPSGYVDNNEDCDDMDNNINPDAIEIAGNGIDEDCDGVDEPSAIHELGNITIEIFPNPVSDILSVLSSGSRSSGSRLHYSIYDLKGDLIAEGMVTDDEIGMEFLSPSVYLLVIRTTNSDAHIMERIIKL